AAEWLSSSPNGAKQSNNAKLEIYGLYKYLTVSPHPKPGSRPGMFDLTGRAKWDSWDSVGKAYDNRPGDVEARYIQIARDLGWNGITSGNGGMGVSVSVMADSSDDGDEEVEASLHGHALSGEVESLTALADQGADVNILDEFGYTPLHLACDRGQTESVRVLLKYGADTSIQDADGNSAVELARIAGHEDIVHLLEQSGATGSEAP
ncbi:hypothetical protein BS47DRAFT_1286893, partial [Hydnum rufescens UP504]